MVAWPWLEHSFSLLSSAAVSSRLHHALLIAGPEGMGKAELATTTVNGLMCDVNSDLVACGQCKSCKLTDAGTHPDFRYLSQANNGLSIDEIRSAISFVQKKSQIARNRVLWIEQAELMTEAASNAILKTLEEPAPGTFIVLTTAKKNQLLPTIVSRCFLIQLHPDWSDNAIQWLTNQAGQQHDFGLLLKLAGGAPLTVMTWLNEGEVDLRAEVYRQFQAWQQDARQLKPLLNTLEGNDSVWSMLVILLSDLCQQLSTVRTPQHISALTDALTQFEFHRQTVPGINKKLLLLSLMSAFDAALHRPEK